MGKIRIVLLCILLLSVPLQALATSWAYPLVVWDGKTYEVTDEYVTEVDRVIGHVTSYSDMESHSGNFSNAYHKGTKYYSIAGVSTDDAIAVEIGKLQYKKAVIRGEYANAKNDFDYLLQGLIVLAIGLIIASILYFYVKRNKT